MIAPPPLSLHKRPIKPRWLARWLAVTGRVKEKIRAGRQIGQAKQIHPVAARRIGADLRKPIGVAQGQTKLVKCPPKNLKGSLPMVAGIEAETGNMRTKQYGS
jgi:hypothetical protein